MRSEEELPTKIKTRIHRHRIFAKALVIAGILKSPKVPTEILEGDLPIIHALSKHDLLDEREATEAMAKFFGFKFMDLNSENLSFDKDIVKKLESISMDFLREHCAFPVRWEDKFVLFAATNPLDIELVQAMQFAVSKPVKLVVAEGSEILDLLSIYSNKEKEEPVIIVDKSKSNKDEIELPKPKKHKKARSRPATRESASKPKVKKAVVNVVTKAVKRGASEIHLEPEEDILKVALMIDGKMKQMPDIPPHMKNNFIARCKMLGAMPIQSAEPREQEGTGEVEVGDEKLELSIKTYPTIYGDKVIMRVPQAASKIAAQEKKAIPEMVLKELHSILDAPGGILLIGKGMGTSQLDAVYSCLNYLKSKDRKIITTETTLQYNLPGIEKVPLDSLEDEELREALSKLFHADPDVVFVDTLHHKMILHAALVKAKRGCKVIIAMNQGDSQSMLDFILSTHMPADLLATTLQGIFSYCSIDKICPSCKKEAKIFESQQSLFDLCSLKIDKIYAGIGCKDCKKTGYLGKIPIHSVLTVGESVRSAIEENRPAPVIVATAEAEGFKSLSIQARDYFLNGYTTFEQVYSFLLGLALNKVS